MTDSSKPTENQIDGDSEKEIQEDTVIEGDGPEQPDADVAEDVADDTAADEPSEELPEEPAETEEPVHPETPPAPEPAESSGGGFMGTVLGGVIAAGIGFGAAQFIGPLGLFGDDQTDPRIDELVLKNDEVAQTIADLKSSIAAQAPVDYAPQFTALTDQTSDLSAQIDALVGSLDSLDARLTEVEKRPLVQGDVSGAVGAYEKELQEMRDALAAQRERNDDLMSKVEEAASAATAEIDAATADARALEARAAVMRISAAIEAGTPFAGALPALEGVEVPDALTQSADSGVASVAQLEEDFADAARAALAESLKSDPGTSTTDRLGAFLRAQTGARSLTPREGDDPDAVLSRAEAAVQQGDLTTALTEIAALPQAGQDAMSTWTAAAQARLDALAAVETLIAIVN